MQLLWTRLGCNVLQTPSRTGIFFKTSTHFCHIRQGRHTQWICSVVKQTSEKYIYIYMSLISKVQAWITNEHKRGKGWKLNVINLVLGKKSYFSVLYFFTLCFVSLEKHCFVVKRFYLSQLRFIILCLYLVFVLCVTCPTSYFCFPFLGNFTRKHHILFLSCNVLNCRRGCSFTLWTKRWGKKFT